jgi:NAD+ kinase
VKKILLVANNQRPGALAEMEKLAGWLKGKAEVVAQIVERDVSLTDITADYVVSFGGDGTILDIADRLADSQIPVLGVNLGRLGYLAEISPEEMFKGAEALLSGDIEISERMMLKCTLFTENNTIIKELYALNDILAASAGRIAELDISINSEPLTSFRGDGVIVATPTGSTAHSLSAGGPILSPAMQAMVLTPVCPHELANRPLVVTGSEVFSIKVSEKSSPVRFEIDGRDMGALEGNVRVEVTASDIYFKLIQMPDIRRYDILRHKLCWGGRDR